jgi:hypothetical protein
MFVMVWIVFTVLAICCTALLYYMSARSAYFTTSRLEFFAACIAACLPILNIILIICTLWMFINFCKIYAGDILLCKKFNDFLKWLNAPIIQSTPKEKTSGNIPD